MNRTGRLILAVLLSSIPASAIAEPKVGVVLFRIKRCDYYPVSTPLGITILEWYGGRDPDEGDKLVGEIESYGMKDVVFLPGEQKSHVWVEDYWLSADKAMSKLKDKCRIAD